MSFFIVKIEKKIYICAQYTIFIFIHWIKFQRKNNIWIYSSYSNKDQLRNIFLKKKFNKVLTWVKSRKIDFFNQKFDDSKLFSYKANIHEIGGGGLRGLPLNTQKSQIVTTQHPQRNLKMFHFDLNKRKK